MKGFYIDIQPDGSVRYRLSYTEPLTHKTKRVSVKYPADSVRNRRKAEAELSEKVAELTGTSQSSQTLDFAISRYLEDSSSHWRESTLNRNSATLGRVLKQFPEGSIYKAITPQLWRDVLHALSKGDATSYNEYLKRVKAFLRWSLSHDFLDDDYTGKLAREKTSKDDEDKATDKYLEKDEVAILVPAMELKPRWQQITKFMLLSGMRCGEVLALNDEDVGEKYISVTKTLSATTQKIGLPKTKKSLRDVSITPELAALIREIREYNAWLKASFDIISPLFFFNEKGKYPVYYSFNKFLAETSLRVLGHQISTHWLRHTHASFLLAAGVPIDVISRRLGHESTEITQRVYIHIIDALKDKDAALLSQISLLSGSGQASKIVNI